MVDKKMKKRLKEIKKEIDHLKKEYKKIELLPCQNDADLRSKDAKLKDVMATIYSLEIEQDRFILDSGRISHSN